VCSQSSQLPPLSPWRTQGRRRFAGKRPPRSTATDAVCTGAAWRLRALFAVIKIAAEKAAITDTNIKTARNMRLLSVLHLRLAKRKLILRRFQCKEAVNGYLFGSHKKNRSRRMQSLRGRVPKGLNMFTSEAKLPAITVGSGAMRLHPRLFILNRFAAH
jgi:hypothetical protein